MTTNWYPTLQSAHDQGLSVAISERKQSGRQSWETHHAACRIVALTPHFVTLDDHTRIPLSAITSVTIQAAQGGASPFVGRHGFLRYTVVERWPVTGGAE